MPCPLYKDGLCLSPRRSGLTAAEPGQPCQKGSQEYVRCQYYDKFASSSIERLINLPTRKSAIVASIHLFNKPLKSQCERFLIIPEQGGFITYCGVLNRYLTIYEAEICEKHYQTCPLRRLSYKSS